MKPKMVNMGDFFPLTFVIHMVISMSVCYWSMWNWHPNDHRRTATTGHKITPDTLTNAEA